MGSPRSCPFVGGSNPAAPSPRTPRARSSRPWPVISAAHREIAGCNAAVASRSAAVAAATMISISHVVSPTSAPPNRGVRHPRRVALRAEPEPVKGLSPAGFEPEPPSSREDITAPLPAPARRFPRPPPPGSRPASRARSRCRPLASARAQREPLMVELLDDPTKQHQAGGEGVSDDASVGVRGAGVERVRTTTARRSPPSGACAPRFVRPRRRARARGRGLGLNPAVGSNSFDRKSGGGVGGGWRRSAGC